MCQLYITLLDHCILERCINTFMPEQLLKLLNWHTFIDCLSSQCSPEFMWMDLCYIQLSTNKTYS